MTAASASRADGLPSFSTAGVVWAAERSAAAAMAATEITAWRRSGPG